MTRKLLLPALVLIALALASCGGGDDTTVTETEPAATAPNPEGESSPAETQLPAGKVERSVKVEIADFAYDPDPVQVETGGKVIWQNMDSAHGDRRRRQLRHGHAGGRQAQVGVLQEAGHLHLLLRSPPDDAWHRRSDRQRIGRG